jgi:hypothetical protein
MFGLRFPGCTRPIVRTPAHSLALLARVVNSRAAARRLRLGQAPVTMPQGTGAPARPRWSLKQPAAAHFARAPAPCRRHLVRAIGCASELVGPDIVVDRSGFGTNPNENFSQTKEGLNPQTVTSTTREGAGSFDAEAVRHAQGARR